MHSEGVKGRVWYARCSNDGDQQSRDGLSDLAWVRAYDIRATWEKIKATHINPFSYLTRLTFVSKLSQKSQNIQRLMM